MPTGIFSINLQHFLFIFFRRKYFDIQIFGHLPIGSHKGFADYSIFGGVPAKKCKIIFRLFLKIFLCKYLICK